MLKAVLMLGLISWSGLALAEGIGDPGQPVGVQTETTELDWTERDLRDAIPLPLPLRERQEDKFSDAGWNKSCRRFGYGFNCQSVKQNLFSQLNPYEISLVLKRLPGECKNRRVIPTNRCYYYASELAYVVKNAHVLRCWSVLEGQVTFCKNRLSGETVKVSRNIGMFTVDEILRALRPRASTSHVSL